MYFNFRTVGCFAHNVRKLVALTRYFDSWCNPVVIGNNVSCILQRKAWFKNNFKKVFWNKFKLSLTSLCLIILSQDSFFNISVKIDAANCIINLFLTSLKLPICHSKILLTQRGWASWLESSLIIENTWNEFVCCLYSNWFKNVM